METTIINLGTSAKGTNWILVEYFEGNFAQRKPLVVKELLKDYKVGAKVTVPKSVLKGE